jgi:quercetin dioxygenase-like cupin family protein
MTSRSHLAVDSDHLAELKQAAERELETRESSSRLIARWILSGSSLSSPPYKRARTLDSSRWYMGSLVTFLAESKDTDGGFALIEYYSKPGNEPPPHVHEREDEFFYILEGEVDAYAGKEVFSAGAGECFFFRRRIPHAFVIRSPRLRALILISPAGFEKYFRVMSSPAGTLDLPPDAVTYLQGTPEEAVAMGAELGTQFLSPGEIAEQMPAFPGISARSGDGSTASD